jgi:hypothetical protein
MFLFLFSFLFEIQHLINLSGYQLPLTLIIHLITLAISLSSNLEYENGTGYRDFAH